MPPPDSDPADPQQRLPRALRARYRAVRPLGRGSFGEVWEAEDLELHRPVALKLLQAVDNQEWRLRFLREARITAELDHPHVVRIFDAGAEEGAAWIVFELVRGGDLAGQIQGDLSQAQVLAWGAQVASALGAAHQAGILHRDVKPENILIRDQDHALLADFGVARADDFGHRTATGMILGTPDFMAPELLSGAAPTPASDQFALAVTLHLALGGEVVYPQGDLGALIAAAQGPWRPPDGPGPACLTRAMARDPGARFARLDELAAALEEARVAAGTARVVASTSLQARTPSRVEVPAASGPDVRGAPTVQVGPEVGPRGPGGGALEDRPGGAGGRSSGGGRPRDRRLLAVLAATVLTSLGVGFFGSKPPAPPKAADPLEPAGAPREGAATDPRDRALEASTAHLRGLWEETTEAAKLAAEEAPHEQPLFLRDSIRGRAWLDLITTEAFATRWTEHISNLVSAIERLEASPPRPGAGRFVWRAIIPVLGDYQGRILVISDVAKGLAFEGASPETWNRARAARDELSTQTDALLAPLLEPAGPRSPWAAVAAGSLYRMLKPARFAHLPGPLVEATETFELKPGLALDLAAPVLAEAASLGALECGELRSLMGRLVPYLEQLGGTPRSRERWQRLAGTVWAEMHVEGACSPDQRRPPRSLDALLAEPHRPARPDRPEPSRAARQRSLGALEKYLVDHPGTDPARAALRTALAELRAAGDGPRPPPGTSPDLVDAVRTLRATTARLQDWLAHTTRLAQSFRAASPRAGAKAAYLQAWRAEMGRPEFMARWSAHLEALSAALLRPEVRTPQPWTDPTFEAASLHLLSAIENEIRALDDQARGDAVLTAEGLSAWARTENLQRDLRKVAARVVERLLAAEGATSPWAGVVISEVAQLVPRRQLGVALARVATGLDGLDLPDLVELELTARPLFLAIRSRAVLCDQTRALLGATLGRARPLVGPLRDPSRPRADEPTVRRLLGVTALLAKGEVLLAQSCPEGAGPGTPGVDLFRESLAGLWAFGPRGGDLLPSLESFLDQLDDPQVPPAQALAEVLAERAEP